MDCEFCAEFAGDMTDSRIITDHGGWVLLPTVGCFTPGYCLFMPRKHIDAVADASAGELPQVEAAMEETRARVEALFGPTIVAEHGSRDCRLGSACCTHAHLHLIPMPDPYAVSNGYEIAGGAGIELGGLVDLPHAASGPYLYLSTRPGEHRLWLADARFPRQFVRRLCARLLGRADQFDWREHHFHENQQLTADQLAHARAAA